MLYDDFFIGDSNFFIKSFEKFIPSKNLCLIIDELNNPLLRSFPNLSSGHVCNKDLINEIVVLIKIISTYILKFEFSFSEGKTKFILIILSYISMILSP